MEKHVADDFINRYLKKIYGFSVSKTFSLAEAEELCAEITCEVYTSLLKMPELYNPDGYVWRISENVYAKHVMRAKRDAHTPIDGLDIPVAPDFDADDDAQREYAVLRREIAYLTKTRREIIMLFYFEQQKVADIALKMQLPVGTVKWHLSRARNELKEGLYMNRTIGKLGLAPIRFEDIGHNGKPGKLGGPEAYISGVIEQNILYSVYFEPKNEHEIADELGISPVYLEDIIEKLEHNGFLTRTAGNKLTTYVVIAPAVFSADISKTEYETALEAANLLREAYVPLIREAVPKIDGIYVPRGNLALLTATLLSYAAMSNNYKTPFRDLSQYLIKPTDGGEYIAHTALKKVGSDTAGAPKSVLEKYWTCGPMYRQSEKYPGIGSWSIDSALSTREGLWQNNLNEDYDFMYEFISGKLEKGPENAEKYKRLYDRRYIGKSDDIQIIVCGKPMAELDAAIPAFPAAMRSKLENLAERRFEARKQLYPPRMYDLAYAYCQNVIEPGTITMLLDRMIREGELPDFTDIERVTLNLIMFSDKLPEG
jgi:RNA polymerase sigma factor (sigma-70 family)